MADEVTNNIVRVNNQKDSELAFEVIIQGVSEETPDDMLRCRFVIHGPSFDVSLLCRRVPGTDNRWTVTVPPMPFLHGDSHKFSLWLVVDGYFFEPATGNLIFVAEPEVNLQPDNKPKVTATFMVTEPDEDEVEVAVEVEDEEESTEEPEEKEEPKKDVKKEEKKPEPKKEVKKEVKKEEKKPESKKEEKVEESYKPLEKPTREGFLFKKDKSGKKHIKGIKDPEREQKAAERSARIKEILKR